MADQAKAPAAPKAPAAARKDPQAPKPAAAPPDTPRAEADERVKRATEAAELEVRPVTHPGLKSAVREDGSYSVERELREQWPLSAE